MLLNPTMSCWTSIASYVPTNTTGQPWTRKLTTLQFGSVKSSPQLKEGSLRSGQYDGSNEDGYILGSSDSSSDNSPLMMEKKASPPRTQNPTVRASRSASPAPMTGFVSGTSPMYHNLHVGFPFNETHAATAIRG